MAIRASRPPSVAVVQAQLRAHRRGELVRDGQAQARAAGASVAGAFHPVEGLEHGLELIGGNARPVVDDRDDQPVRVDAHPHAHLASELQRVVDQVRDDPAQRIRARHDRAVDPPLQQHVLAGVLVVGDHAFEQRVGIDAAGRLRGAVQRPRIGDAFPHQRMHGIEVLPELQLVLLVVHHLGAQPHPGDGRLEVVRDGGQDLHALGHVARDSSLHGVEGACRVRHFGGAFFRRASGPSGRARARPRPRRGGPAAA